MSTGAVAPGDATVVDVALATLDTVGGNPILWAVDEAVSGHELSRRVEAVAATFADRGVGRGDRVAVMLQSTPEFVVTALATWHVAAVLVTVNPMLSGPELRAQLDDCRPSLLVVESALWELAAATVPGTSLTTVLTVGPGDAGSAEGVTRMDFRSAESTGGVVDRASLGPDDIAVLIYTSGTTGPAKGAMLSHRGVLATATAFRDLVRLGPDDTVLGMAPLFHVTGFVLHLVLTLLTAAPLVLMGRFDPAVAARLIADCRPTFTIGAITAYMALAEQVQRIGDLSFLRAAYTGGAPVSETTVEHWLKETGVYIHNAYGLTESSAPCVAVPCGQWAPVDPEHGALSIGRALPGMEVRVRREDGSGAQPGELGELLVRSPGMMSGYWRRPEETAAALTSDGLLRTGDVGFVDAEGWVFLVDRKKDVIIASGYKVWPRDVEDALYQHPHVREAAVVGAPDPYRGETVVAYVSVRPGASIEPEALIDFCRPRLAAYKRPTRVVVLTDLPKTQSGKILRRSLREAWDLAEEESS